LIADIGLRWDEQTYLPSGGDEQVGPRTSLLYRLDGQTDLRLSYGRFFQSQGLIDLQIEDGIVEFAPAQHAAQTIVGLDHRFPDGLALRAELFRKTTHNPRPRYENLFDPLVLLPELRPGRVRIAPERGEADGVVAVPGPRDAERLSPTRRVDFRASRSFALGLGTVRVFAEVTNITDRDNVCCVQYRQAATPPNEAPALEMDMRGGLPSTVNFG